MELLAKFDLLIDFTALWPGDILEEFGLHPNRTITNLYAT
jgi:hypothetical protein